MLKRKSRKADCSDEEKSDSSQFKTKKKIVQSESKKKKQVQKHIPIENSNPFKKPETSTFNERIQLIQDEEKRDIRGGTSNNEKKNPFTVKTGSEDVIDRNRIQHSKIIEEAKQVLRDKLKKSKINSQKNYCRPLQKGKLGF